MQSSLSPTHVVDQALAVRATQAEQDRAFLALSPAQRAAAMWRFLGAADVEATAGEPVRLTMNTLYRWALRFPREVPLIDGEFAFIAAAMPEYAETPGAIDKARGPPGRRGPHGQRRRPPALRGRAAARDRRRRGQGMIALASSAPAARPAAALADEARAWLAEIEWADLDREEALQLPDEHAIAAVDRHYDGGLAAFIADGAAA